MLKLLTKRQLTQKLASLHTHTQEAHTCSAATCRSELLGQKENGKREKVEIGKCICGEKEGTPALPSLDHSYLCRLVLLSVAISQDEQLVHMPSHILSV